MQSRESGGRDIRQPTTAEEARAYIYAKISKWGDTHGLPSDAEYSARLDAAYARSSRRGRPAGMTVERLRLAETARKWRTLGFTEREVAGGLSLDPPMTAPSRPLSRSALERLERDLRKLEAREGAGSPPRPERDTAARQAAAYAQRRAARAGDAFMARREKVVQAGGWPNEDPACLRVHAAYLRLQVESRQAHDVALRDSRHGTTARYRRRELAERDDMLTVALRFERWANTFERSDRETQTAARRREVEEGMTTSDIKRLESTTYERLLEDLGYTQPPTDGPDALDRGRNPADPDLIIERASAPRTGKRRLSGASPV
jgi:hypothetical protein